MIDGIGLTQKRTSVDIRRSTKRIVRYHLTWSVHKQIVKYIPVWVCPETNG